MVLDSIPCPACGEDIPVEFTGSVVSDDNGFLELRGHLKVNIESHLLSHHPEVQASAPTP